MPFVTLKNVSDKAHSVADGVFGVLTGHVFNVLLFLGCSSLTITITVQWCFWLELII